MIICGLDSVEARRWINATLVNMVDWNDPERTLKPLIEGGTEGERINEASNFPPRFPWTSSCNRSYPELLL
jgi:molybdopterin/thiamine biosynthesis adenylyltransferase